ncbi:hypothetical protein Scep_027573 [Stephania cephalantha]|uniref:Uncharacterized protein n=1 Tax=Stephania cephalantha TaxID=152367 RepID=A0AAP0E8A2_9MAGN
MARSSGRRRQSEAVGSGYGSGGGGSGGGGEMAVVVLMGSRDSGRRGGTEDADGAEARTTRMMRIVRRRVRRGGAWIAAPASVESSCKGVRSSGGDRWQTAAPTSSATETINPT